METSSRHFEEPFANHQQESLEKIETPKMNEATGEVVNILNKIGIQCTPEELNIINYELSNYKLNSALSIKAKKEFINESFRTLAKAFHPDTGVLLRDHEEMIKANNAHDIATNLENPDLKALYNQFLILRTVLFIKTAREAESSNQLSEQFSKPTAKQKTLEKKPAPQIKALQENIPLPLSETTDKNTSKDNISTQKESDASELLDRFSGVPPKEPDDIEEEGINRPDLSSLPDLNNFED